MEHGKIFKRPDGTRIMITCDSNNNFYITIHRCHKGKKTFKRIAPIWSSDDDTETGIHYNGAHLIDIETNMCIVSNGITISDYTTPNCEDYSRLLFATAAEILDTKLETWNKIKPVK
jgi:hypothetical protein